MWSYFCHYTIRKININIFNLGKGYFMKIMHLSDLHLGKNLNGFSLYEDQRHIHKQILQMAKEEAIDAVMIAGDVFDKSVPTNQAIQLFDEFLTSWAELHLPVFIISGNHDSAQRVAFGANLFKDNNIFISPIYNGKISHITLKDEHGNINFYLLPFIKPAIVRSYFPEEEITSYNQAVKVALKQISLNPDERNILIAHQFVTGAYTCDSEEIIVGGIDNIDAQLFQDFDYVALGHLHTPQNVLTEKIRYCGTLLKYSFSETNQEKTVTILDFPQKNKLTIYEKKLSFLHDMRKLKGSYAELTLKSNYEQTNTDDYLAITLTDEEDIPDAINRLRSIYPNIMQLTYDNLRTKTVQNIETTDIANLKTPLNLFEELYYKQNNQNLNDKQIDILQELIQDIWEGK